MISEASSDGDQRCGLADNAPRLAAAKAVEDLGLEVSQDRRLPVMSLDLATAYVKEFDLCVSNVRVVLSTMVVAVAQESPGYKPSPGSRIGRLEVVSRQAITWAAPAAHGERVRARITEFASQIATEIKLANQ